MSVNIKDIVTIDVSEEDINQAKEIRQERDNIFGNIYPESETDQRWSGDLGEIIVNKLFCMCRPLSTDWHLEDVAGKPDFTFCGVTLDIKTVKRKVPMRTSYGAQITAKHIATPMDYIVFTCFEYPVNKLHVLGAIKKKDFIKQARYYGSGEKVHEYYTIRNGHEIYSIEISKLIPFRQFVRMCLLQEQKNSKSQ